MSRVLVTARLRLEPVTDQHLPLLVALNRDAEVMRYVESGRPADRDETAAEWQRRLVRQSDPVRGLGYWVGFEHETFVGWWSASAFADDRSKSGIGYRLPRAAWGRGLATEGGRAMLAQAFAAADVERVVASTMAINTGSRRVLEKLGLVHVSSWVQQWEVPIPGSEHGEVGYSMTRGRFTDAASLPPR